MRPNLSAICLATALGLSGCTSGLLQSHVAAGQVYVLRAAAPGAAAPGIAGAAAAGATLRVQRPLPAPGLDTDRVVLVQSGNRLDYYTGGRWSAPLPEVVSDLAVAALRGAGTWTSVTDARVPLNVDYQLQLYVEHFEAVYPPGSAAGAGVAPIATVGLRGLLVRRSDGHIVANLAGSAAQQAAANRMGSVVEAFEAAANAALGQIAAQAASAR